MMGKSGKNKDNKNMNVDNLKQCLLKNGIHPSFHRLKVFEHLLNNKTHPTVEQIYKNISKEIPTLSKTTIYNTLKCFIKNGIVSGITIDENELRYDIETKPHLHFRCNECSAIYDIKQKCGFIKKKILDGHKILEQHIYLKGICKNCLK